MVAPYYMPILRAKRAELQALLSLGTAEIPRVKPLIEPCPPGAATYDRHLTGIATQVMQWGFPVRVDDRRLPPGATVNGIPALSYLCVAIRAHGRVAIPTIGPGRPSLGWISPVIDSHGLCIRLSQQHFGNAGAHVSQLLSQFGVAPKDVDVLLDLGAIGGYYQVAPTVASNALGQINNLLTFRSVTVAMGSFPGSITSVKPDDGLVSFPRREVTTFSQLVSAFTGPLLGFGDYTVGSYDLDPVTIDTYGSSANVRYATNSEWFVARAARLDRNNGIYQLCADLTQHPAYSGPS